ncbi:class I SAM-dependent methyltransferase [Edaphobacter sp. 12200R-103]|jgi:SAM-dependent methyltransferase|uniref:class I SAM-dependent methyltransferase n=1 Tax=Edaphobacter sp. 12200R-103 TaxID=2703788 RepID=UPI00138D2488|nr:class I SAM-dependent methyltransferase [Edaphobacter sp. 12200R-103]QHS51752.1 methyltransferase domain-containing protein [Edaphobacter sp. 12200R-103]
MTLVTPQRTAAAAAFDHLAVDYDAVFTHSSIGSAQRAAVWECAKSIFTPHSRLLELNCGTGEDAIHFAEQGFNITSCDISPAMISQARRKALQTHTNDHIRFYVQANEKIGDLPEKHPFSGCFSNFSGLNCVKDLNGLSSSLAPMLLPGSPLLFCFSTRYCLWEIAWHLLRADLSRCSRRWSGYHETTLGDTILSVYYPTCREISRSFAQDFRLIAVYGIGITVPPSYVEPWIAKRPGLLQTLQRIDTAIYRLPMINRLGDHMLLHLERLHS